MKRQLIPRTRNGGTWTESEYWVKLRWSLRRTFRFWKPAVHALHAARIPYKGPRGQKWAYRCADCGLLFKRTGVEIDHVVPAGSLRCMADVAGFIERLTPEDPKAYAIRCLSCHRTKTQAEAENRKIKQ